jgi:hypothetical protein
MIQKYWDKKFMTIIEIITLTTSSENQFGRKPRDNHGLMFEASLFETKLCDNLLVFIL